MRSSHFIFLVGGEKTPLTIHIAVLEKLSAPLYALISNGSMKESRAGVATLDDVDVETFVAFSEFAYTNRYKTPSRKNNAEKLSRSLVSKSSRISKRVRTFNSEVQKLREDFNERFYHSRYAEKDFDDYLFESIQNSFMARTPGGSVAKIKANADLLFHAKLYIFATKYLIEPLRKACLSSLHFNLVMFEVTDMNSYLILDLLKYVYSNTGRNEPTGKSSLRDLVIHYAAYKLPILSKHEGFSGLLESNAEIGLDLVMEMMK